MNKRVAKPKRKTPLIPGEDVTEAQMERYLREHRDEVSAKLRKGKAALDRGDAVEISSLSELLTRIHRRSAKRG
jgi:hypothetical protein